jgi:modified peptide precursor CbpA
LVRPAGPEDEEIPMEPTSKTDDEKNQAEKTPDIIATRRTCDAEGVGLSHYILVDAEKPE